MQEWAAVCMVYEALRSIRPGYSQRIERDYSVLVEQFLNPSLERLLARLLTLTNVVNKRQMEPNHARAQHQKQARASKPRIPPKMTLDAYVLYYL